MPWRTVLNGRVDVECDFFVSDQAALALDSEKACPCPHKKRGLFEVAVGTAQRPYYDLCLDCGTLFKAVPKKRVALQPIFFDHVAVQQKFTAVRNQRRMAIVLSDAVQNGHDVRGRKYDYPGYRRSPEWQQKRNAMFVRANFICEMCHIEKATQVHHLTYARIFFEEPEDLIAVCASCHFQLHKDDGMPKGPLEATT